MLARRPLSGSCVTFIGLRFGDGKLRFVSGVKFIGLRFGDGELRMGDGDGDVYLADLSRTVRPGVTDGDTIRRRFGEAEVTGDDEVIRHVLSGLPGDGGEGDGLLRCGVNLIGVRVGRAGGDGDFQSWLCVLFLSDNALHCASSLSFIGALGLT